MLLALDHWHMRCQQEKTQYSLALLKINVYNMFRTQSKCQTSSGCGPLKIVLMVTSEFSSSLHKRLIEEEGGHGIELLCRRQPILLLLKVYLIFVLFQK